MNDAVNAINNLHGKRAYIAGALSLEFEGTEIQHLPKSERQPFNLETGVYPSCIWCDFDLASIGQKESWLWQFDGRHVIVEGELFAPSPEFGGCGHMSLWPARLLVTGIRKQ